MNRVDPLERLTLELARLPSIGAKSAQRLAHYILRRSQQGTQLGQDLAQALIAATSAVRLCDRCQNFTTRALCSICEDHQRMQHQLCVVESVADLKAIETSGGFRGCYYVLHGVIAPLDGVGPEELKLDKLYARVCKSAQPVEELILATNASVDGDATAMYIKHLVRELPISVTRLASGMPMGGELEYLDSATVMRAFSDRRTL